MEGLYISLKIDMKIVEMGEETLLASLELIGMECQRPNKHGNGKVKVSTWIDVHGNEDMCSRCRVSILMLYTSISNNTQVYNIRMIELMPSPSALVYKNSRKWKARVQSLDFG